MSVEATIKNLLAESRKLKESMDDSVSEENVVTKNATAPEGKETLDAKGSPSDGSGDNEDNKRNNVVTQKAAEGGTSKTANAATAGATAPEGMEKIKEEEQVEFDMSQDVEALFDGEEGLTEEFKNKAETIFEAAVVSRVKTEVARLEEEFEQRLDEKFEEIAEGLVEHVDGYLNLMVEQWMENNEVALESGLKSEVLEGFVAGLKNLFQEHYIEVPDEKYDVIGAMEEKIEELTAKVNETTEKNVELHRELSERVKSEIISEHCEGLSDIETEKFTSLAEELTFEGPESFAGKLQTIRESYFKKSVKKDIPSIITEETVIEEEKQVPANMKHYVTALTQSLK